MVEALGAERDKQGTSTEGWKGFKRIIKDATRVCRHEARPEREGDLRGRGGRIEMEKRAEPSEERWQQGGLGKRARQEDGERSLGFALTTLASASLLTLLQRLGWGADTTSWG